MIILPFLLAVIDGTYSVSGYDPGATTPYTGTAEIMKAQDAYNIKWDLLSNGKKFLNLGTGVQMGNTVSFVFKSGPDEKETYEGVQLYKIKGDTLEGPFVLYGETTLGQETLKRTK